jgi:hypothetical protein
MLRLCGSLLLGLGLYCASASEIEIIDGSTSPNHAYAVGYDYLFSTHLEAIWRVALPSKKPIGEPYTCDGFIGLKYHGGAVWNMKACLVAVVQGGIPFAATKVFHYSRKGLHELPLPDLDGLPDPWYREAHIERQYIIARRWKSKSRLEIEVSGDLTYGENPKRFFHYELDATVAFGPTGQSKIVHVTDKPLQEF